MNIQNLLGKNASHKDIYYYLLTASWPKLLLSFFIIFTFENLLFGTLYFIIPHSINGMNPSFADAFFFSIQTFSTIGFGSLAPTGFLANIVVFVEAFLGMIAIAIITGVVFAKISRPQARIRFSKNLLISKIDVEKNLFLRMGNTRENEIVEARIHATALIEETTPEGESIRRMHELKLKRDYSPFFRLTWVIFHPIDIESPLFNLDIEKSQLIGIMVTVTGHDGTFSTTIYHQQLYNKDDIVFDKYFVDIMRENAKGETEIDYKKFDDLKKSVS